MRLLWKPLCLASCFAAFVSLAVKAQCTNTLQSITYDTLITGTGNDSHVFTLSQFDPSIGTLVSAKINSTISLNYGFTLKNVEAVQRDFSVSVGRYDHYTSAALSSSYTNVVDTNIGDFVLNPGDTVSKLPYTILYQYSLNDSITSNVVNFLGNNSVAFNYKPITYTNLTGSNVYYYSATANDTIHFSITYYYCNNSILANDIISFSATNENNRAIKLSWATTSNLTGRNYEIEAGNSATQFFSVGSEPGSNNSYNYSYDYKIAVGEKGKKYFRLKIIDASGDIKYSEVKMIDIADDDAGKSIFVYPNPSDIYINIAFKEPQSKDWNIWIYSSSGMLVQKSCFTNTSLAHMAFKNKMPTGIYFVKAESIDMQKKYLASFIVK